MNHSRDSISSVIGAKIPYAKIFTLRMATSATTGFTVRNLQSFVCSCYDFFMDLRTEIRNARKRAARLCENSQELIFYTFF